MFQVCGSNINVLHQEESAIDLTEAAQQGKIDIVLKLLEIKVNANCVNEHGSSPLLLASLKGHSTVVEVLLQHGGDVHKSGPWGWTPLHGASYFGHIAVVNLLLESGANVEARNNEKKKPGAVFQKDVPMQDRAKINRLLGSYQGISNQENNKRSELNSFEDNLDTGLLNTQPEWSPDLQSDCSGALNFAAEVHCGCFSPVKHIKSSMVFTFHTDVSEDSPPIARHPNRKPKQILNNEDAERYSEGFCFDNMDLKLGVTFEPDNIQHPELPLSESDTNNQIEDFDITEAERIFIEALKENPKVCEDIHNQLKKDKKSAFIRARVEGSIYTVA